RGALEGDETAVATQNPARLLRGIRERLVGQVRRAVTDVRARTVDADELRGAGREVALLDVLVREGGAAAVVGGEVVGQALEGDGAAVGADQRVVRGA